MAEVVGLVLAAPGVVERCIEYGKSVMDIYHSFKHFKEELENLIMRLDTCWINLEFEIKFFAKAQDYVEDHIQIHFGKIVNSLYAKLQNIELQVKKISNERKKILGKIRFVFLAKSSLEAAISDFAECHSWLQPVLYLLPRSTDPRIDQMIYAEQVSSNRTISTVKNMKQAFKTEEAGEGKLLNYVPNSSERFNSDRQLIQYTQVEIKRLSGDRHVIINSISCEGDSPYDIFQDVHSLARILKEVDPMTFGIPACTGVVKVKGPNGKVKSLEMVFDVPQELETPRSLRNLLLSLNIEQEQHSINIRIQLAKRLARTVLFVHSANFVHKNFRPETIIIFDHSSEKGIHGIGIPFLIGFEKVRLAGGRTKLIGDTAWEKNIYRHPSRQGNFLEEAYSMEHDIYSLGVCLLEIALWKSFVCWDASGRSPSKTAESEELLSGNRSVFDVKEKLIKMARELIPNRLGDRYTEVTLLCLKCLDKIDDGNSEFLSEDGVSIGASYIEKILEKLDTIAV